MPMLGRNVVRVSWDTAYAGDCVIDQYEVIRNGQVIGTVPHTPQSTRKRFFYDDHLDKEANASDFKYKVVSVDIEGNRAETQKLMVV